MQSVIRSRAFPIALAAIGGALMLLGVWRGEAAVVLRKAVYICLECIGIG